MTDSVQYIFNTHFVYTNNKNVVCVCALCAVLLNCCQNSVDESYNDGYTIIEST